MPVDRAAPRREPRRQGAKGQADHAFGVQDGDRGFHDALLGQGIRTPVGSSGVVRHAYHIDSSGTLIQ